MIAEISDLGATLVSLTAPDRAGNCSDIALGFDSVEPYLADENPYFGATVGRCGNRIAHGRFTLDGVEYPLAANNHPNGVPCHLHGGNRGFSQRLWEVVAQSDRSITLHYNSPHGEEGYPGNVSTTVTYTLTPANELIWEATATADSATIINLIQHSYWNLSGEPGSSIIDHIVQLHADHYLPTDDGLIPLGQLAPVAGTPMDFTRATRIGERIEADFEPLRQAGGYDHCWVLTTPAPAGLAPVATVHEPTSGRIMEVFSNQPAVQFYTGNFLDGSLVGKQGARYGRRSGLCIETENFPDAANQAAFPSAVLRPGEIYQHKMLHRFSAK